MPKSLHTPSYDFANILFSGKCNAQCPYCIGSKLEKQYPSNLDLYPLPGIEKLITLVRNYAIPEIISTGTTTDPLLYRHQISLGEQMKSEIPEVRRAVHTNGFLILKRLKEFHQYTKCTLSIPSFQKRIFRIMMGTIQSVPDVEMIMRETDIPIKLSRIVDRENNTIEDTRHYLERCLHVGVSRVAFRKLFSDRSTWEETIGFLEQLGAIQSGQYRGNPVYLFHDIEITLWSFDFTESRSINLFSDGSVSHEYILEKHRSLTDNS